MTERGAIELSGSAGGILGQEFASAKRSRWRAALGLARRQPLGAIASVVILCLLVVALMPSVFAPDSLNEFNVRERLEGPSSKHWFGTDQQGRDVFSRVAFGARVTVIVGFTAVAVGMVFATIIGVACGYYRGKTDLFVQRVVDIWLAFPGIIFVIYFSSIVGTATSVLVVVIGFLMVPGTSRIVRSAVIGVMAQPYIEASRAIGASSWRIMWRHVLPNIAPILIIAASVLVGSVVLIESSLSYLGYGVKPPYPSWGRMLQESQDAMYEHPYLSIAPGVAIAAVVFSFNMLGDALRDLLDPRLRGSK